VVGGAYLDPDVLQQVSGLELYARRVVEGLRVNRHRSRLKGASTDFAQHRQYVQGDPIRHIDWRVWGRTGRYHLKQYQAETDFSAHLLLDASGSMHYGRAISKLEYAKRLAACLAWLVVRQQDAVGLAVFDDALRLDLPAKASMGVVRTMAAALEGLHPRGRTGVDRILRRVARRIRRRGHVVLLSDLFDGTDDFLRGLEDLRRHGHDVLLVHVLDPDELAFPFAGTCRFEGLEGEAPLLLAAPRVRDAYLAELRAFTERIRQHCRGHGIAYVPADTARPVPEVLAEALEA
jgi:uncharacterized protein (DUF58 family)